MRIIEDGQIEARLHGVAGLHLPKVQVHLAEGTGHNDRVHAQACGQVEDAPGVAGRHAPFGNAERSAATGGLERKVHHPRSAGGQHALHEGGVFRIAEVHDFAGRLMRQP